MTEAKKEALSSEELEQVAGGGWLIDPDNGQSDALRLADNDSSSLRRTPVEVNLV